MINLRLHVNWELVEGRHRRTCPAVAADSGHAARPRAALHSKFSEHLLITEHATLTAYAEQYPTLSLARLAWRLGADTFSPADVATVLLEEAIVAGHTKECAYNLLVRSLNDVPSSTISYEESQRVTARVLIAWWLVLSAASSKDALRNIVATLLTSSELLRWRRPLRCHSRMVRRVFDAHWMPARVELPFDPLLATAEQA